MSTSLHRYADSPEPKQKIPGCTPSAQQPSNDTDSDFCDSSGFVGAMSNHAERKDINTTSANPTGEDKSTGISLIPVAEPRKKSKGRNSHSGKSKGVETPAVSTDMRSRKKTSELRSPEVTVQKSVHSSGKQKCTTPAKEIALSKTVQHKQDKLGVGQITGKTKNPASGKHSAARLKPSHLKESFSSVEDKGDSQGGTKSHSKGGSSTSGVTKTFQHTSSCGQAAEDKTPPTKQGQKSTVRNSLGKRKRTYQSAATTVDSDSSDEDARPKKLPRKEAANPLLKVNDIQKTQTMVTSADQSKLQHPGSSSEWTSEEESTSVPIKSKSKSKSKPKSKSKFTDKKKSTAKANSTIASRTTAAASKGKSNVGSPSSSAVKLGRSEIGKPTSQVCEDSSSSSLSSSEEEERLAKQKSKSKSSPSIEVKTEDHLCPDNQNELRAEKRELDDVFSFQSTFRETHNKTTTLYMKSSTTDCDSPKDPRRQTDKRATGQSTSKGKPGLTSALVDVPNIPKEMAETVDDHSSEEILAEDSQDLDVDIIPATQPTARSDTAETTGNYTCMVMSSMGLRFVI